VGAEELDVRPDGRRMSQLDTVTCRFNSPKT
jgi:hypothetical protein